MAKKQTTSQSKKTKIVEKLTYKNSKIEIVEKDQKLELRVQGKPVWIDQDPDTGNYFSPELPYQEFSSQIELGKKLVDQSEELK